MPPPPPLSIPTDGRESPRIARSAHLTHGEEPARGAENRGSQPDFGNFFQNVGNTHFEPTSGLDSPLNTRLRESGRAGVVPELLRKRRKIFPQFPIRRGREVGAGVRRPYNPPNPETRRAFRGPLAFPSGRNLSDLGWTGSRQGQATMPAGRSLGNTTAPSGPRSHPRLACRPDRRADQPNLACVSARDGPCRDPHTPSNSTKELHRCIRSYSSRR